MKRILSAAKALLLVPLCIMGSAAVAQDIQHSSFFEIIEYEEVDKLLLKCDAGDVAACNIGMARNDDIIAGMTQEDHRADKYKKLNKAQKYTLQFAIAACIRDDGYGCYRLAFTNLHGVDGAKIGDIKSTTEALEKSCRLGSSDGCAALAGSLWASSDETELKRARELSYKACAAKSANGCAIYGYLLQNGKGGPQDYELASSISLYACENGHNRGCGDLAQQFEKGLGVKQSNSRAFILYGKQCKLPFGQSGCRNQKRLKATLVTVPAEQPAK